MTREDALLYLPYEDEDELDDLYQEKLFAFKQKVLSVVPSTKLYQFHLKKMSLVHGAYVFLTKKNDIKLALQYEVSVDQSHLKLAWRDYNQNKTELKLMLSNAANFFDVKFSLGQLLENQRQFALFFNALKLSSSTTVIIGKEPDAMALGVEIEAFVSAAYSGVKGIEKLDTMNMLYQEANRLSLWLKLENNVG
jgi:hypothetical protein